MPTTIPQPAAFAKAPLPFGYDAVPYLQGIAADLKKLGTDKGSGVAPFSLTEWASPGIRPRSYAGHLSVLGGKLAGSATETLPSVVASFEILKVSLDTDTAALEVNGATLNLSEPPHLTGTVVLHGTALVCLAKSHLPSAGSPGVTGPIVLIAITDPTSGQGV